MTHHSAATLTRADDPIYFLGRDDAEAQRLIRQGRLYNPSTRWMLQRAGLQPGMRVLDVGSGSGDVALLVRELVGTQGAVVGIDQNPDILHMARARAEAAGYRNVFFHADDIRTATLDRGFDAVVGRFVLMYISDPAAAVGHAVRHLVPGGIVAFQEMNLTPDSLHCHPAVPLWEQAWSWICQAAQRAGIETVMGYRLRAVFAARGLVDQHTQLTANVGAGLDDEVYDYIAATIRSMLPLILSTGVATATAVDIDTLGDRLRSATAANDATIKYPNLIATSARLPANEPR